MSTARCSRRCARRRGLSARTRAALIDEETGRTLKGREPVSWSSKGRRLRAVALRDARSRRARNRRAILLPRATDRMVKVRGYRVEPGEVEITLGAHPAVMAAVVAHVDPRRGATLRAFVTLRDRM